MNGLYAGHLLTNEQSTAILDGQIFTADFSAKFKSSGRSIPMMGLASRKLCLSVFKNK